MSFIGRTLAATTVTPFTPETYDAVFSGVNLPANVTPDGAMAIPAVYACTTVICEDIAKVPLQIFEAITDGKRLAREHPLYDLLHDSPNDYQTALEFREMMTAFALNRDLGGVAEIIPGRRGPVDKLVPLHPDLVTREITDSGDIRYQYEDPIKKRRRTLTSDQVFVLRGRFGRSVLSYARESLSMQLAMQQFGLQTYKRGPRHTGVISRPKDAPKWSDNARSNFRKGIDEYMGEGERAGRPMLLEDGMSWQSASITMADAEFLGTLQHGVADVCRWYRVPQHKVQELLRSTNNNIEQQSLDYIIDSLMAWAVRWEQAISRDLIVNTDRFFAEHNLDALLRGDTKSRAEAYAIAVQWGWMTRAEVRKLENYNPIDGLDEPLQPLNMVTLDDKEDVEDDAEEPTPAPTPFPAAAMAHLRAIVRDNAARIIRMEHNAMTRLAAHVAGSAADAAGKGEKWEAGVRDFYLPSHADFVARLLRIPDEMAERYAEDRAKRLIAEGPAVLTEFTADTIDNLTEHALAWANLTPEAA
jgi:HK97 family phage portal protein